MQVCKTYSAKIPETLCAARHRKYKEGQDMQFVICGECDIGKKAAETMPIPEKPKYNCSGNGRGWSQKVPFFQKKEEIITPLTPLILRGESENIRGDTSEEERLFPPLSVRGGEGALNNGGKKVANVAKSKICTDCKKEYAPTSSAQKRCVECAAEFKKSKDREYSKKVKKVYKEARQNVNSNIIEKLRAERDRIDQAIQVIEKYA